MVIDVRKNMKAEINNENRRKFEALYFGQDVFWSCREPMEKTNILDARKLARPFSKYDAIELKPLSLISDEDAIEVAKMMVGERFENSKIIGQAYAHWLHKEPNYNLDWKVVQYFRKKRYACPFEGLSVEEMIEAGWIKLVES
jgi:hypothetical protein